MFQVRAGKIEEEGLGLTRGLPQAIQRGDQLKITKGGGPVRCFVCHFNRRHGKLEVGQVQPVLPARPPPPPRPHGNQTLPLLQRVSFASGPGSQEPNLRVCSGFVMVVPSFQPFWLVFLPTRSWEMAQASNSFWRYTSFSSSPSKCSVSTGSPLKLIFFYFEKENNCVTQQYQGGVGKSRVNQVNLNATY